MAETSATLKRVKELPRKEIVFTVARVPGTRRVVFGGSDFRVYEADLAADKPEARALAAHESYVTGVAVAKGQVVSGGYDGRLIWSDLEKGNTVRSIDAHTKWIRNVAATRDGSLVASVADDMVCRLWDAETGSPRHELRGHEPVTPHHFPSMLFACAFTSDGRHVATADKVGHIVIWETQGGQQCATLEAPMMYTWDPVQRRHSIGGIRALAFSPDGSRLAVGGIGKIGNIDHLDGLARVEVFDWQAGKRTHEFPGESVKGLVECLAFHPDGNRLLAVGGANDGFLMLLDLKAKTVLAHEKARTHIHDAAFDEKGESLITAAHGKLAVYALT